MDVLEQEKDTELEAYELKLIALQEKLTGFATITANNFEEAAIHIGACKAAERWIESQRDAKVRPLNEQVKGINALYKGAAVKWESARTRLEQGCSAYRTEQKRLADERQRLELEAARKEQAEKEEKLRIERETLARQEEAARIALEQASVVETDLDRQIAKAERELLAHEEAAPENMSEAYMRQLTRKQEKVMALRMEKAGLPVATVESAELDAKREEIAKLESAASVPVVAQVVEQVEKLVRADSGTVSFREDKKTWILPGWSFKDGKYRSMDAVDAAVYRALPEDIQWLLKVSVLDVPALNQSYKNRDRFPLPFGEVAVHGGSVVRSTPKP